MPELKNWAIFWRRKGDEVWKYSSVVSQKPSPMEALETAAHPNSMHYNEHLLEPDTEVMLEHVPLRGRKEKEVRAEELLGGVPDWLS